MGELKTNVILVDERDQEIGEEEKMIAHEKGLLHRAVSVMIINDEGEMLLQKRAENKYHCGGLRSNAACTHPQKGESCIGAAHRRLAEEMGFDVELEEIFKFIYMKKFDNGLIEHEYDHVFLGYYDGKIVLNEQEVSNFRWIKVSDLRENIKRNPNIFTARFKIILEKYSNS